MAQTGFTPILIYSSSTAAAAPAAGSLTNSTLGSELAINITDGKLFYKDNANAIQVIGWKTVPTSAGGTGLTSYTTGDLIYYASGTTFTKLGIGSAYQALQVNAGGTAPSWQASASSTLTAQGDLLYASAANTLARLAKNTTATRYLANTGTTNNPQWDQVNLANGVTGTLSTGNGGTGLTSFTANGVVYASSTSALTTGSSLVFDGSTLISGAATSPLNQIKFYAEGSAANNRFRSTSTTASGATIEMTADSANSGQIAVVSNHPLVFLTNSAERSRFAATGEFLVNATSLTQNGFFTNGGTSSALATVSGTTSRAWAQTYTVAASNNATVDAWLGRDAAGNVFGANQVAGHFYVYVTGASGANAFSGVYSIITTGNGTSQATLAAVSTVTRGTSPVTSIQIANDGAGGAVKLTITYINNSGVVTGGSSRVTFIGQLG